MQLCALSFEAHYHNLKNSTSMQNHSWVLQLPLCYWCLSWDKDVSYYFSVATGWAEWAWLWMSENGIVWSCVYRRCTEFYMLMKEEEGLGQASPEFRPWLPFLKIFTSSLFHPRFLSGMSVYIIASPFKMQFWEFTCWLCQQWWRDAFAPWLCCVVCYKACDIMWLPLWICSQQRVLWSK